MKKLIILLSVEVALCIFFTSRINCAEYDSWTDITASVNLVTSISRKSSVNGSQDYKTVSISYLDNNAVLDFKNYYPKIKKGDTINVKYNPDDRNDVIYLPYEEHCVAVKKKNTILLFLAAIVITIVMFIANIKNQNRNVPDDI
ncbi:MAG: hypothetical protein IKN85_04610 [Oscillospiraceae bacterium]|nr:hypothetical protein [Oscillospiraceae bacterium]MBR3535093.1 hypothetical protein [Oscillospiraceae bacterium]MBR6837726.1 hypothetical protein [Oscillospiraceae bacterium]